MKLKSLGMLMLSFSLFAMPSLARAETECKSITSNVLEQGIERCAKRDRHHSKKTSVTLADYSGDWVFTAKSQGGLSVPDAAAYGTSLAGNGGALIQPDGIGEFIDYREVLYLGGENGTTPLTPSEFRIQLTDPENGIGKITFTDPVSKLVLTLDFVSVIEAKERLVHKIIAHLITPTPTTSNVLVYEFFRDRLRP